MNLTTYLCNFLTRPPLEPMSRPLPRVVGLLAIVLGAFAVSAAQDPLPPLRPPAVPLVTHDPYFSIWSVADSLTGADTVHWTGKRHRLASLVRVDGKCYRLMGTGWAGVSPLPEPGLEELPPLPQTSLEVLPTRTLYTFEGAGLRIRLTFLTPALPDDLDLVSRPVTYLTWECASTDERSREVELYFEASGELAVNEPSQLVEAARPRSDANLVSIELGSTDQLVLRKKGDDLRIEWGALCVASPRSQQPLIGNTAAAGLAHAFARFGAEAVAQGDPPLRGAASGVVAPIAFRLGPVGLKPISRWLMLAYDDEYSIKYFGQNLRPYWRRNGADAPALLARAAADYESLGRRCAQFDARLLDDLRRVGGARYAQLCALAYRQTLAGNKLCADADGQPLMFPKENFSNGCIGTVDVLFPQAPFFLVLSPALTKAMLVPVLDYASSPRWPYAYAPHDLGTYPHATGQVYGMGGSDGDRMPVEESGNMLIMLAALARQEGNATFAKPYWPMLTQWADYLVKEGLDPTNQLCSADMFGHLPRNANLALKAIIGIGGYAQLAESLGEHHQAARYLAIARDDAVRWQELARDEGHTRLAYHQPGTWSMKHNLIWDRVLGLELFPASIADAEIAWYLKVQNKYGLPVDKRTDTCLIDWALWSIAPARRFEDFETLLEPIFRYVHETPSRVPLSDWFFTTDAKQRGFQARPVVGGLFIRMLADRPTWKEWASRGAQTAGPWAPLPVPPPTREVVPTALTAPAPWRYTFEQPPEDWFRPGFDDAAWATGPGGFGTQGTPGAVIGTEWKSKEIWLRRTFTLPDRPLKNPQLRWIYDEDPVVYLNGVLAAKSSGWTVSYDDADIAPEALAALRPGTNLIAARARQTYGGQSLDVGLVEEGDPLPVRKLFDTPVRDTSICVGPDGAYYLTGTTAEHTGGSGDTNGWWYVNEGIRVWRSPDLTNWTALGLVWSFATNATWQQPRTDAHGVTRRALWAPDIHYFQDTFWLTYCVNYRGTGLLRSQSGKAEGPYVDMKPDGPITDEIDASLFRDEDGTVYFVYQDGKIARLRPDMSGLAEEPRLLKPANFKHVGFEGAFLIKIGGRYHLVCAEFNRRDGVSAYDCMMASSDSIYGPYGDRYLAIPHAGHNMLFQDRQGQWWATFFGNDPLAPWRERPGLLPIRLGSDGRLEPKQP